MVGGVRRHAGDQDADDLAVGGSRGRRRGLSAVVRVQAKLDPRYTTGGGIMTLYFATSGLAVCDTEASKFGFEEVPQPKYARTTTIP